MKVENKVKQIIREEFDERVALMVIQNILDKGTGNLEKITEEKILRVKGNGLMTDGFVQALVRCSVRISKECNMIDDFLPYIVTELYVPNAKSNKVTLYKEDFPDYSWTELLKELDMDYDEDVEDIVRIDLSAVVTEKYYKDK